MAQVDNILKIRCPHCQQKLDVTQLEAFSKILCPACGHEVIVPRRFGEFYLEEPIGSGGTATVYRALDLTLDREVAVKTLNAAITQRPEWVKRFLCEARSAASVNHPSVVPTYSCGDVEGVPYLVMQFMGGLSLDRQIKNAPGGLPMDFCLKAVASVAKGLAAAHRHGIVHHDVKPGNILVDADGNVKIGDFGLAQIVRDDQSMAAREILSCWASPYYVSPEKVRSGKEDFRGDIYSLGATLYHALTGVPPFSGEDATAVAHARVSGELPPSPSRIRSELPPDVSDLSLAMLHPDPGGRPQSYEELTHCLERVRKGLSRSVSQWTVRQISHRVPATRGTAPATGAGNRHPRGRLFSGINVLLLIAVPLLLVLLGAFTVHQRPAWYVGVVEPHIRRPAAGRHSGPPSSSVNAAARKVIPESLPGASEPEASPVAGVPTGDQTGQLGGTDGGAVTGNTTPAGRTAGGAASPVPALRLTSAQKQCRPRPADLDFVAMKAQLQRHLNGLPPEARPAERERILLLSQTRDYLVALMKYLPYGDGVAQVKLRDGSVLDGSLPYCTADEFTVRLSGAPQGGLRKVTWGELAIEQYVAFFDYYMRVRASQGGDSVGGTAPGVSQAEVAEDCIRIALLCDWYGMDSVSHSYALLAQEKDPGCAARLHALVQEEPADVDHR